jgi:hypothetical protein
MAFQAKGNDGQNNNNSDEYNYAKSVHRNSAERFASGAPDT